MKYDLNSVKKVLRDLQAKIAFRIETMGHSCSSISPELGSGINFSEIEQTRCWMFATDHYLPLMTKAKIERHIPPLLLESASKYYDDWLNHAQDLKIRSAEKIIPHPNAIANHSLKNISIYDFLLQLAELAVQKSDDTKWIKSLTMFAHFLRQKLCYDEQGYLNEIIPPENKIEDGLIARYIPATRYPIDQFTVAKTIQNLIKVVLFGEKTAQKNAAEAVGLLCPSCGSE